jgi:hypothetical protein
VAVAGEVGAAGEEEEPRCGARHGRDLIGYACSSAFPRAERSERRAEGSVAWEGGRRRRHVTGQGRRGALLLPCSVPVRRCWAGPLTSCEATAPAPV